MIQAINITLNILQGITFTVLTYDLSTLKKRIPYCNDAQVNHIHFQLMP